MRVTVTMAAGGRRQHHVGRVDAPVDGTLTLNSTVYPRGAWTSAEWTKTDGRVVTPYGDAVAYPGRLRYVVTPDGGLTILSGGPAT